MKKKFIKVKVPILDSDDRLIVKIKFPKKHKNGFFKSKSYIVYRGKIKKLNIFGGYRYDTMLNALFMTGVYVRNIIKNDKIKLNLEGFAFDWIFPLPESLLKYWDDCDHLFKPPFQE